MRTLAKNQDAKMYTLDSTFFDGRFGFLVFLPERGKFVKAELGRCRTGCGTRTGSSKCPGKRGNSGNERRVGRCSLVCAQDGALYHVLPHRIFDDVSDAFLSKVW